MLHHEGAHEVFETLERSGGSLHQRLDNDVLESRVALRYPAFKEARNHVADTSDIVRVTFGPVIRLCSAVLRFSALLEMLRGRCTNRQPNFAVPPS